MKYLPLLVCLSLAGCETAKVSHALLDAASSVRVAQSLESVKACTLLGGVSATETDTHWSMTDMAQIQGVSALTLLQFAAKGVGADTVLVTSSQVSQATDLTTLTGDAYRCASGSK